SLPYFEIYGIMTPGDDWLLEVGLLLDILEIFPEELLVVLESLSLLIVIQGLWIPTLSSVPILIGLSEELPPLDPWIKASKVNVPVKPFTNWLTLLLNVITT